MKDNRNNKILDKNKVLPKNEEKKVVNNVLKYRTRDVKNEKFNNKQEAVGGVSQSEIVKQGRHESLSWP